MPIQFFDALFRIFCNFSSFLLTFGIDEPNRFSIWDLKLDSMNTLWLVNNKNSLFRAYSNSQHSNGEWELSHVASVSTHLKSKVQGKMLRLNQYRNYIFWKSKDTEVKRINVKTGHMRVFRANFKRDYDFITDFKSNKDGKKLCVLSRYGNVIIFITTDQQKYKTVVKLFYDKSNILLEKFKI